MTNMSGVPDPLLMTLEGWPGGVDNLSREDGVKPFEIPNQAPARLRSAVNVDLDDEGKPARRAGYENVIAGSAHSLYSSQHSPYGFVVLDGVLTALDATLAQTTIRSGVSTSLPVSYAAVPGGTVFWSNRQTSGRITPSLADQPLAVDSPKGVPTLASSLVGSLQAGRYQIAITYVLMSGEESGTSLAAWIDIGANGRISLSSIPQPESGSGVVTIRIYMTPPNGDILYRVRDIPVGMTSAALNQFVPQEELQTQWVERMPPGQIVRYADGRLYIARGNVLLFSEPLRYGYYNAARNYFVFEDEITMVAPIAGSGRYVAAGKYTYWLSNANPTEANKMTAYPHGAVAGTHMDVSGDALGLDYKGECAYWVAANGVPCIGLPDGRVQPLTDKRYVAPHADIGASFLREKDGDRHVVFSLGGQQRNARLNVGDRVATTVTRNGVTLD